MFRLITVSVKARPVGTVTKMWLHEENRAVRRHAVQKSLFGVMQIERPAMFSYSEKPTRELINLDISDSSYDKIFLLDALRLGLYGGPDR